MAERNPLMAGYPPLQSSDLDLYADAAYATPMEPFIRGQVAYGYPGNDLTAKGGMVFSGQPVAIEPTEETRMRSANVYRNALLNPVLAVGADDPSRLAMLTGRQSMPWIGDKWYMKALTGALMRLNGIYAAGTDVAIASPDRPGTDSHELMHRGLNKLGYGPSVHHELITAQDALGNPQSLNASREKPNPLFVEALPFVQEHAASELAKRRPRGPR